METHNGQGLSSYGAQHQAPAVEQNRNVAALTNLSNQAGRTKRPTSKKKEANEGGRSAWTEEEEIAFFTNLRGCADLRPEVGLPVVAARISTKSLEEVTAYYNRTIRQINKLLGPNQRIKMEEHVAVHRAMLLYQETKVNIAARKQHGRRKPRTNSTANRDTITSVPAVANLQIKGFQSMTRNTMNNVNGNNKRTAEDLSTAVPAKKVKTSAQKPAASQNPKTATGSLGTGRTNGQNSKGSSKAGKYEGKIYFQLAPLNSLVSQSMRNAGYAEVLDLHISKQRSLFSVLEHLRKKWYRAVPGAGTAGTPIQLHAPVDSALPGKVWGGKDLTTRTEVSEIFEALKRPNPVKLHYSWGGADSAPAPSAISGQQHSKKAINPALEIRKAMQSITMGKPPTSGGPTDPSSSPLEEADTAGQNDPTSADAERQPTQVTVEAAKDPPVVPRQKTAMEMLMEDTEDGFTFAEANPAEPTVAAPPPAAPIALPQQPVEAKKPMIRRALWAGNRPPALAANAQVQQQQQQQQQQPVFQAPAFQFDPLFIPTMDPQTAQQMLLLQAAQQMPLPTNMLQYLVPPQQHAAIDPQMQRQLAEYTQRNRAKIASFGDGPTRRRPGGYKLKQQEGGVTKPKFNSKQHGKTVDKVAMVEGDKVQEAMPMSVEKSPSKPAVVAPSSSKPKEGQQEKTAEQIADDEAKELEKQLEKELEEDLEAELAKEMDREENTSSEKPAVKPATPKDKAPKAKKTQPAINKAMLFNNFADDSNGSWLVEHCPSPPSIMPLPDDFESLKSPEVMGPPEPRRPKEGTTEKNNVAKGIEALFADALHGDGDEAGGRTSSLLPVPGELSKLSLLDGFPDVSNPLASLMGGGEKSTTWMAAFENNQEGSTAKSKGVGDRPFAALFSSKK